MMKMTFEEVVESIKQERDHQDQKWGNLKGKNQSIAGILSLFNQNLMRPVKGG